MKPQNGDYYRSLTVEELAADENFQQWVLLPDNDTKNFWITFQETYPDQKAKIKSAQKLVQELSDKKSQIPARLSKHEKQFLKSIIYRELGFADPVELPVKKNAGNKWSPWALSAAATVIVIFFVTKLFWVNNSSSNNNSQLKQVSINIISEHTAAKEIREIILPDSSVVILNGNSSIQYSNQLSSLPVREVTLTGNAYFNVKKKISKTPFVVYANDLNISVTGTEFNVNARSKTTDVVLTSGKVNVSLKNDQSKKAQLEAGEKLNLDTLQKDFVKHKIDTDLYTAAWKNKEWHFQETSLETIAGFIKEYYGVDVVFENKKSRSLMITAVVSVNDFQTLVNILERTLNINIQVENQQLIIH
ncbi:MAG: FecR family protein [Agriterribacter sp.]